jgi:amino acid transporter
MKKLLASLLVPILAAAAALPAFADSTPAIYKVTDGEGRFIYLMGTCHVLTPDCLPIAGIDTSVMTVLSASAMGYAIANFVALAAFVKSRRDPKFKDLPRPFKAPGFYTYVGMIMCCLQVVLLLCLVYWSYVASGDSVVPTILGVVILLCFVPVWVMVQKKENAAA